MNDAGITGTLGVPVEADPAAIERELVSYWRTASGPGQPALIRACSCNLLTFVENRKEAEEFPPILAKIAEWHPSRSVVAFVETGETPDSAELHSWITAQCSTPIAGGPQVCSEMITLQAAGKARFNLPDIIVSILMPDLPVFLYWRSFNKFYEDLMRRMIRFSHMLIVDSNQSRKDPAARLQLLRFLINQPADITVRDLNWSRITAWRDLIAQFFDSPATRGCLDEIREIEITRNLSAPGSIPTRTLLLTSWLASRLGWKRISAERSGDQWLSRWKSRNREVRVTFTGTISQPGQTPGISSVVMRTDCGDAEFSVTAESGSACLRSAATMQDCTLHHSVSEEPADEASLLIHELSHSGRDTVYMTALAEALELEESFLEKA